MANCALKWWAPFVLYRSPSPIRISRDKVRESKTFFRVTYGCRLHSSNFFKFNVIRNNDYCRSQIIFAPPRVNLSLSSSFQVIKNKILGKTLWENPFHPVLTKRRIAPFRTNRQIGGGHIKWQTLHARESETLRVKRIFF